MKDEIKNYNGSVKTYTSQYGDLYFEEGYDKEILEAAERIKILQREQKIDKLLNENK